MALFETLKADDIQYNDYKKVDTKTNAYNLFSGSGADNNYKNAYAIQTKVAYDF